MELVPKLSELFPNMSKKYILATYETNYADEFDVQSIWLTTEAKWKKWVKNGKKLQNLENHSCYEISFGTNEYIEISSFQEVLEKCKVQELTEEEAAVLNKFFGNSTSKSYEFKLGTLDIYDGITYQIEVEFA